MESTSCDLIAKDNVIRVALADQEKVAAILAAPPRFTPGLERAFAAHRKLIHRG